MLLLLPYTEYLGRLGEPRNIADIVLVFLLVYAVLKLVRGTRASPMAAALAAFALLYWLAVKEDLATLEFILRGGLLYIGVAIIVLFQAEIRQVLILKGIWASLAKASTMKLFWRPRPWLQPRPAH
jgi:DNA integrity scanning protein DisA with diadenylate cyclase activity